MEDIRNVTDRWLKRFEIFFEERNKSSASTQANQEGQIYVPPPKRTLLLTEQPRVHALNSPETMDNLLNSFVHLFLDPQGLPPQRRYDNRIHLKDPTKPTAVRPY